MAIRAMNSKAKSLQEGQEGYKRAKRVMVKRAKS
jgi:hypothetical protein